MKRRAPEASTGSTAVATALFSQLLDAIAEEMGVALQRAAFSPNIKERRDYSCALFLGDGTMIAQAAHIPVHLGSCSLSVLAVKESLALRTGDEAILNDPFRGGTHLPDVTVVRPVFLQGRRSSSPELFVANRAHHADIGGATPGSMGLARDIQAEGFRIPPVHLARDGALVRDFVELFRAQVRQPAERFADIEAQRAANHVGATRLLELVRRRGADALLRAARELPRVTATATRGLLAGLANGRYRAADVLDDDGFGNGPLPIRLTLTIHSGTAHFDFAGTAPHTVGPFHANLAIVRSCVGYALRCLLSGTAPLNDGVLEPVTIELPRGCLLAAEAPSAVAAGNVETSQRILDVIFRALAQAAPARIPAASAGTMSNLSFGARDFTYYETIGGGSGATRERAGASAVQTHMTNTRNTPIEVLESSGPLRVTEYSVRRGSGGRGQRNGGDGIVRAIEALEPMHAAVLADRQRSAPYGLEGGASGRSGRTTLIRKGTKRTLPAKMAIRLERGDELRIETPGGGGYGRRK